MNRSKLPMPAKARKKMSKEIKAAQNLPSTPSRDQNITPAELLSRYPEKRRTKELSLLKTLKKEMEIKKKKLTSKHSKRTTPSQVDQLSPPKSPHREGKRWIQTTLKQTKEKTKIFSRQMNKKK